MIVVVITCVVVIVALVVAVLRLRDEVDRQRALAQAMTEERDVARATASAADARSEAVLRERDDALERVNRSKRDAAEVANRLSSETAARADTETELESVRAELEAARAQGVGGLASVLWELAVRQAETTWRRSIAVDPMAPSPFADGSDEFRTAVEIEVDAAREESGAALEVEWSGDAVPAPERSIVALAAIRDLINQLGTVATETALTVSLLVDAIEIDAEATDADGNPIVVSLPSPIECAPGRARIA